MELQEYEALIHLARTQCPAKATDEIHRQCDEMWNTLDDDARRHLRGQCPRPTAEFVAAASRPEKRQTPEEAPTLEDFVQYIEDLKVGTAPGPDKIRSAMATAGLS